MSIFWPLLSAVAGIRFLLPDLPAFAESPVQKDGDECEKSIRLRFSADGYASAGFAEAVKMPRGEARGASLDRCTNGFPRSDVGLQLTLFDYKRSID